MKEITDIFRSRCSAPSGLSRLKWAGVGGAMLAFLPGVASACVGCREPGTETLLHESPTVMAGSAFSWSVLFMLAFVFVMIGGMTFYIWRTCQRLERERVRP
jgi:hypothetical protein